MAINYIYCLVFTPSDSLKCEIYRRGAISCLSVKHFYTHMVNNVIICADDMQMNSRFMNYPLSVKWTAFIPSVIGLVLFVSLVSLYGRFPAQQVR
jgi:hypothetical protein